MTKEGIKVALRQSKEVKQNNNIPAILYGKGVENQMLWVDSKEFGRVLRVAGRSTLIDVQVEGEDSPRSALIQDVQIHPLTGNVIHVDFFQVDMKEKIEADIELLFTGTAPAVKELGGTLVKSLDKLSVRCLPGDLISHLDVDISAIKTFEDYIHVKDLNIPNTLEVLVEEDTVVALVTPPRSQAEMDKLDEEVDGDISQVEGMEEKTEGEKEDGAKDDSGKSEDDSKDANE